ncbi:MAG: ATPase domain-containing protein, partial [Acidilobus sp.]
MESASADWITIPIAAWSRVAGNIIRRGSIILVAGYPGAGKTTLASQFAYAGAASGEPSLYVSFVEPRDDFIDNALSFGMDFRPL